MDKLGKTLRKLCESIVTTLSRLLGKLPKILSHSNVENKLNTSDSRSDERSFSLCSPVTIALYEGKTKIECPHCSYEAKVKTHLKQHMHEEHVAKRFRMYSLQV